MSVETITRWQDALTRKAACREAIAFADGFATFGEAWATCERGDWMLWWLGRSKTCDRKELVRIACQCARLALPYVHAGELRPLQAIELAERWANGEEVNSGELRAAAAAAAYAARNAAYAAYADAAYDAAAADAADADAAAAAYAARNAAYAAYAAAAADAADADAAAAARNAAAAAARNATFRQCADIVRASYPEPPLE